jgi:hypothetical protein
VKINSDFKNLQKIIIKRIRIKFDRKKLMKHEIVKKNLKIDPKQKIAIKK